MKLHLDLNPEKPGFQISREHRIVLLGSCFAENIGDFLSAHKFNTSVNPGGIMFDPASIFRFMRQSVTEGRPDDSALVRRDRTWFSFDHHSSVGAGSPRELMIKMRTTAAVLKHQLSEADFLFISLGTAISFRHLELGRSIANCHKQPQDLFERVMMDPSEIADQFLKLEKILRHLNSRIRIIFTVSPVKYLSLGAEKNNLSKAVLLLAVSKIRDKSKNSSYFPSYELVNDDLRDYRFYKEDLAHPNDLALRYVWEKFQETYFDERTRQVNLLIGKLMQAQGHRPMHKNGPEAEKLGQSIQRQKAKILSLEPGLAL